MKSVAWKLAAGVVVSIALGSIACATGGSRSTGATDAATPAESAQAQAPPRRRPRPPRRRRPRPRWRPPNRPSPAAAAPAAPSAPAAAASDSPVAGYLADPQAMTRAAGLFRAVCTGYCHSTQQTANREAPNLFDCNWAHGSSDQEIFATISAGVPDTQMQGVRRAAAARGPLEAGGVRASEVDLQVGGGLACSRPEFRPLQRVAQRQRLGVGREIDSVAAPTAPRRCVADGAAPARSAPVARPSSSGLADRCRPPPRGRRGRGGPCESGEVLEHVGVTSSRHQHASRAADAAA